MDETSKLKTRWFGLNRSDVSRHFRTTKRLQELELAELEREIERLTAGNEALRRQVDALPPVTPPPVEPTAESTTEQPAPATAAEAELAAAAELEAALEAPAVEDANEQLPERAEPEETAASSGPEALPEPTVEADAEDAAETAVPGPRASNVVEFRRRAAEEPAQQPDVQPSAQQRQPEPQQPPKPEHAAPEPPARKLAPAVNLGFWGSANAVMEQVWSDAPPPAVGFEEIAAASTPAAYVQPAAEQPKRIERKEELKQPPTPKAAPEPQAPAQAPAPATRPAAAAQGSSEAPSAAISEEIRSLRSKYIVGKWAGEDLFDAAGKRIIAKGAVITEDVVEAADRSGKLAELIVNMVIPGLGD